MPVHDWTKADDHLYHDFLNGWLVVLRDTLNGGYLPDGYYAFSDVRPEMVTVHTANLPPSHATPEPKCDRSQVLRRMHQPVVRRRVYVRDSQRIVSVVEWVSPIDKSHPDTVRRFATTVADWLAADRAVAVIDLLPPGRFDPGGMHAAICHALNGHEPPDPPADVPPPDRPLTFAGYDTPSKVAAYLNYAAVGDPVPTIPLHFAGGMFIELPLEETYMTSFSRIPSPLRAAVG